jgi:hypothetical protein
MIARNVIQLMLKILIYLGTYLLIFSRLNTTGFSFPLCFSYTAVVLLLPLSSGPVITLLFSFFVGLGIDVYHSSLGIHTAAMVVLGFFRANFLNWMVPAGGYEEYMTITISSMGIKWFLLYGLGLLFLHHLVYFLIEYASLADFFISLGRAILSSIYTLLVIVVIQMGIEPPSRGD